MHKEFEVHMLNEAGKEKAQKIAEAFDTLLTDLELLCNPQRPNSTINNMREMAIVRIKLEEACFFAKKAMASKPENCV